MGKKQVLIFIFLHLSVLLFAQQDILNRIPGRGYRPPAGKGDSIARRNSAEDSITINFRLLDSSRLQKFDSNLTDFYRRYPLEWHEVNLGNLGTAARSLIFTPRQRSGWDHGFHAFDTYNYTVDETRLYNTTRPFSEVTYLLGSRAEQMIQLEHTQNVRPNWNLGVQYRLINSPGFFQNQNTNHNSYRLSSWYQSPNKRYQNFFVLAANKLQSAENGGILQNGNYLDSIPFEERSTIPTALGGNTAGSRNFLSSNIVTGTRYTNAGYLFRQQYDLGQKDSLVTDTIVIPLFYPRLRLEHTISLNTYHYRFGDEEPDTAYYRNVLGYRYTGDSVYLDDTWRVINNQFSIYQFPDAKNPQQFIKVGAIFQNLFGDFSRTGQKTNDYNIVLLGEYRNKTRNRKWDIEALGHFNIAGYNAGDYDAYVSLKRLISQRIGYLQVGFQNVNRSPSFTYDPQSSFYLSAPASFNKENYIHLFGALENSGRNLSLSANYYLFNNFHYYSSYTKPDQSSSIFNLLRISLQKQFRLSRNFNWRTWVVLQQRAGDAPLNLPLMLTRNQVGYDGKLGFKNLNISTGLEFRYFTPYKSVGYSPLTGQFFYQDSTTVKLDLPEIAAYIHFRIRTFTAYFRAENLNSFDFGAGGFRNNQVMTPGYPYPGLQIRLGIFWTFIN